MIKRSGGIRGSYEAEHSSAQAEPVIVKKQCFAPQEIYGLLLNGVCSCVLGLIRHEHRNNRAQWSLRTHSVYIDSDIENNLTCPQGVTSSYNSTWQTPRFLGLFMWITERLFTFLRLLFVRDLPSWSHPSLNSCICKSDDVKSPSIMW